MVEEFRIWDKDICKYMDNDTSLIHIDSEDSFSLDSESLKLFKLKALTPGRFRFQLNTHSRDKNGREIFVGDILKLDNQKDNAEVFRMEGMFCLRTVDGDFYKDATEKMVIPLGWLDSRKIEIIGDINRNPDKL